MQHVCLSHPFQKLVKQQAMAAKMDGTRDETRLVEMVPVDRTTPGDGTSPRGGTALGVGRRLGTGRDSVGGWDRMMPRGRQPGRCLRTRRCQMVVASH